MYNKFYKVPLDEIIYTSGYQMVEYWPVIYILQVWCELLPTCGFTCLSWNVCWREEMIAYSYDIAD